MPGPPRQSGRQVRAVQYLERYGRQMLDGQGSCRLLAVGSPGGIGTGVVLVGAVGIDHQQLESGIVEREREVVDLEAAGVEVEGMSLPAEQRSGVVHDSY